MRNSDKLPGHKKIIVFTIAFLLLLGLQPVLASTSTIACTVMINPLEVSISAPSSVYLGDRFKVVAEIKNLGETKIREATAIIHLPSGLNLISGKSERTYMIIPAKGSKTTQWVVKANLVGDYFITVSVSGTEETTGSLVTAEDTTKLEVREPVTSSTSFPLWLASLASLLLKL